MLFTCDYSQYLVTVNMFAAARNGLVAAHPSSVVPFSSEIGSHVAQARLELTVLQRITLNASWVLGLCSTGDRTRGSMCAC